MHPVSFSHLSRKSLYCSLRMLVGTVLRDCFGISFTAQTNEGNSVVETLMLPPSGACSILAIAGKSRTVLVASITDMVS